MNETIAHTMLPCEKCGSDDVDHGETAYEDWGPRCNDCGWTYAPFIREGKSGDELRALWNRRVPRKVAPERAADERWLRRIARGDTAGCSPQWVAGIAVGVIDSAPAPAPPPCEGMTPLDQKRLLLTLPMEWRRAILGAETERYLSNGGAWVAAHECLPEPRRAVLVTRGFDEHNLRVTIAWHDGSKWSGYDTLNIAPPLAWQPLPEPYRVGSHADNTKEAKDA